LKNLNDSLTIFKYFNRPPANPPEDLIRLSLLLILDIDNPITQADKIPVKFGTRYLYQTPWGYGSSTTSGQFVAEYLSDGGFGIVATSPTLSQYQGYVTADSANGNSNSYSIESQDSVLSLWYGSIWERQRRFVKAI
jgi:hypothetical protein